MSIKAKKPQVIRPKAKKRRIARKERKAGKRKQRHLQIESVIETYKKMSVVEQILSSIAVAFGLLGLTLLPFIVLFIIAESVAFVLAIISLVLYQARQRRNNRLLTFIRIQKSIDLKSINELLGWSEKLIISTYLDIVSSGSKDLLYDLTTKKIQWVGHTEEKKVSNSNELPQEKVYCTYCGHENESNESYCISCGDPII